MIFYNKEVITLSFFNYCINCPVNYNDISGKIAITFAISSAAAVAFLKFLLVLIIACASFAILSDPEFQRALSDAIESMGNGIRSLCDSVVKAINSALEKAKKKNNQYERHHIVAQSSSNSDAEKSRTLINSVGIGVNNSHNLVDIKYNLHRHAISFLVTTNELSEYKGIANFPEFSVGYNTENDCDNAELLSEERWDYAYWSQNNTGIIDAEHTAMSDALIEWYNEHGVMNIGLESEDEMYDENYKYIGKGPNGYWELSLLVSNIARNIQNDGEIQKRFGKIPIIVHGLEYCWYTSKMTENANPNGEAKVFLDYLFSLSNEIEE